MSVAVLDFENLSRDTGDTYLSQGLAEELTSRLGQVSRLTVASRAAVRRLRDATAMPLSDVGRALNVSYLVNGSVRRSGSRLRVTVELTRASTGAQEWTSQYDRSESDLLAIQEAVATAVAQGVAGRLLPAERSTLAARATRNPEAHAAYLRGRVLAVSAQTAAQQLDAAAAFSRAIALDSSYAEAWSALSQIHAVMFWNYYDRSEERLAQARSTAERAAALAPDAATSHIALGYYHYWGKRDYPRAIQEFSAALAAEPNNADVHSALANVERRQGSWERSLVSRTRSLEIDPGNPLEVEERVLTFTLLRRFEEAERDIERAMALPGTRSLVHAYAVLGRLSQPGTPGRAEAGAANLMDHAGEILTASLKDPGILLPVFRTSALLQAAILRLSPPSSIDGRAAFFMGLGQVFDVQGRRAESHAAYDSLRAVVIQMLARRPDDDGFHATLATAYAGLGRCDDALREGQRATEMLPVSADAIAGPDRLRSLAEIELMCGRPEQAIDRLAYLLTIPSTITPALLRADPVYAPLRGNPRFERLVAGR